MRHNTLLIRQLMPYNAPERLTLKSEIASQLHLAEHIARRATTSSLLLSTLATHRLSPHLAVQLLGADGVAAVRHAGAPLDAPVVVNVAL
jgi:hypothetical protein